MNLIKISSTVLVVFVLFVQVQVQFTTKVKAKDKVVLISFDGFRYDYMDKAPTPNLNSLRDHGTWTKYLRPQFSTKTFPNHQSISTGLYTEEHGVIDNIVWDPKYNRTLAVKDVEFWRSGDHFVPIWIWAEKLGFISGVQFPGCETPYGINNSLPTHVLPYNKSRPFEKRIDYIIKWLTDEKQPADLVLMYFDEPDGQAHRYGPNSIEVIKEIQRVDEITGLLIDKLMTHGLFSRTNLIILSDHGLEEVRLRNVINITGILDTTFYTLYGKSPILQIKPNSINKDKLELIYSKFKEASKNHNFSVYKKEEIPDAYHYRNNRRGMPIILLADPGFVFQDFRPRFGYGDDAGTKVLGAHGYDNRAENMRAFFIGHGPGFKRGFEVAPFENVDIFPLICELMGIRSTPPVNGTMEILRAAMSSNQSAFGIGTSFNIFNLFIVFIPMLLTISLHT